MKNADFITVADSKYFKTVLLSAMQISKFYPESRFYIYDWGLTEDNKKTLLSLSEKIIFIPWTLQIVEIRQKKDSVFLFKKSLSFLRDSFLLAIKKIANSSSLENIIQGQLFEMKIFNKFLCIKHFNDTYQKNFIFLDADAFIINSFDELFDTSFDIGVTVRRQSEWSFSYNNCEILNSGVLLFLGGYKKNQLFIDSWYVELQNTHEIICEQTALTRLLHKSNSDIFENTKNTQTVSINNESIRVRVLPCEIYNYNWIEKFNPEKDGSRVKILHFKSGRFKTSIFKEISKKLNIES